MWSPPFISRVFGCRDRLVAKALGGVGWRDWLATLGNDGIIDRLWPDEYSGMRRYSGRRYSRFSWSLSMVRAEHQVPLLLPLASVQLTGSQPAWIELKLHVSFTRSIAYVVAATSDSGWCRYSMSLSALQALPGVGASWSSHMIMPNQMAGCNWKFQVPPVPA